MKRRRNRSKRTFQAVETLAGTAERQDAKRAMVAHRAAAALELPVALLEWRRGRERRAITRHSDGAVTLTEPTGPLQWREARFPDAAAAAAAVTPAILWIQRERAIGYAVVARQRRPA